jgi:RNA polymerase sigma-70 factor (ECF subfamily)
LRPVDAQLKALMVDALAGDAPAYEALLRAIAPALRAYFRKRIGAAADDAEDLLQETLMAIHARRMSYDRRREFLPWAYAIARHKLIDYFRKRARQRVRAELDEAGASTNFEAEVIARIDVETLLAGLTEKQRAAIRATKIEGLSVSEAAHIQALSESDLKVSVHRGLKSLASRIQDH